jgi:hypothetical protein
MAESVEFWTFVFMNFMMFGFGIVLTGLSFLAYRADMSSRSLRNATIGFASLTVGGLVAPAYQLGVKGANQLEESELLVLQSIEGLFLAGGLGLLFYSIYRYSDTADRHYLEGLDGLNGTPKDE